jgi:ABC-type dipeptide/oligopeptide/nickel transport system ATPase subunit
MYSAYHGYDYDDVDHDDYGDDDDDDDINNKKNDSTLTTTTTATVGKERRKNKNSKMVSDDDTYNAMVQCDCASLLDKYQLHDEIITRATMNLSGGEKQRLLLVR